MTRPPLPGTVLVVRPRASGGLAAHVDQELAALAAAGCTVRQAGAVIGERPAPRADARALASLRREIRAARGEGPLAVHAHGLRAGALAALAVPPRRSRPPVRLAVTLHNRTIGGRAVRAVGAALLRILARRAAVVPAVSPDLAEDARRVGAREVLHAIVPAPGATPGLTPAPASEQSGSADASGAPLRVLVLARLAPQKGLEDLLDAVAEIERLPGSRGRVAVEVAGEGPLRGALEERLRARPLPLTLLGRREDVPELLARAQLVVSAARWEGQPVALQEALRAGRAIVATDAGGTAWVTGDAATLVPVGDAHALASAILGHLDPAVRRLAERASQERARSLPGASEMTDQLLDVLAPRDPRW